MGYRDLSIEEAQEYTSAEHATLRHHRAESCRRRSWTTVHGTSQADLIWSCVPCTGWLSFDILHRQIVSKRYARMQEHDTPKCGLHSVD